MTRTALALAAALLVAATPAFAQTDVDKVNGSIEAAAGQAYGSLTTVNGSIRIEAGATVQDAETVNGSIRIADDASVGSAETVNGGIRLGENVTVRGDLTTVNGGIFVGGHGRVGDDIETVNGAIGLVRTELAGAIATVNGDITVGVGSHVRGGITVEKPSNNWLPITIGKQRIPRVVIGPDARVDGPLRFEREVKLYVHTSARIGQVTGATPVAYDTPRAPAD
ncbi:hypothetical protein GCM10028862_10190 [Luteimonas pelagia]